MRIALDATYSVGRNLSGVGVYSREVIAGLSAAHPESHFTCCYRPHRFLRSFRDKLNANCTRAVLHEALPIGNTDIFHALNQRLPKRRMPACVTTFHDLFVLTGEYSTADFRERFAEQAREAAAASDLIIAVSHFTAGQVRDLLRVDAGRVRVVHHGVRMPSAEFERKPEKMILHVGTIQTRKNVSRLVRAFEALPPDWTLVLAGAAGYGYEEIMKRIEASPASPRVRLTGYVTKAELESLYARAGIFAFPSLDEGFGLPILEAMARGVPVLTSAGSALREVAGSAAELVDAHDANSIAQALLTLSEDADLCRELIARGYQRAQEFSWDRTVRTIWSIYQEVTGKS